MKRPAFQFYPADWRKDAALQSCSLPARGLWHEMMCLMHECEPYGHMAVNGKPMKPAQVARLVGITEREYGRLVQELTEAGVPSIADDGSIYSRRMVRDEHIRNVRAEAGKKGGNPNLLVNKVKQKSKQKDNQSSNQTTTPSSSSSSSSSNHSVPNGTGAAAPPGEFADPLEAMKKEIWASGKALFATREVDAKTAGKILGQLLGSYPAETVLDAVRAGAKAAPPDPTAYLTACCQRSAGERAAVQKNSRHNGFDNTDYTEGVTADGRIA